MSRTAFIATLSTLALGLAAPQAATAAGLGSIYSCDAAGKSNTAGTVLGGVVGGLVGAGITRHDGLGAVIGAGLGSALGNNVGCRMDRKAAVNAQTALQRALDTGKPQNWSDPANGVKGKIEVLGPGSGSSGGSSGGTSTGPWRYASGVQAVSRSGNMGGTYAANGRINLRAAPNTTAEVMGKIPPGDRIQVAGVVGDGWYAVERDGYIQGYVSPSVVRPLGGSSDCRLVRQTINEKGQPPFKQTFNACRDGAGAWQVTAV